MAKIESLELPSKVIDSDWKDDVDFMAYEDEDEYNSSKIEAPKDAELIKRKEVKNATVAAAKNQKIGHIALFSRNDKIAA